jgi:hypothetical protein
MAGKNTLKGVASRPGGQAMAKEAKEKQNSKTGREEKATRIPAERLGIPAEARRVRESPNDL